MAMLFEFVHWIRLKMISMVKKSTFIDLSHAVSASIPTWNDNDSFKQETMLDYKDCTTDVKFCVQRFATINGIGTHIDAPAHCIQGNITVDHIPLVSLVVPCIVIDIRHKATAEYELSVDDLTAFENRHGKIASGTLVAINTGWNRFWHDKKLYRNNLIFPCVSKEAAQFLVQRGVIGIAIDTLGVDKGTSGYPAHQVLLSNNLYIIENVTNLDKLPAIGSYVIALPMKIEHATEAPIRVIGILEAL